MVENFNDSVGKTFFYWSNSCGDLYNRGKDIRELDLPDELNDLFFHAWSEEYPYKYLAEYNGGYGMAYECNYSHEYAKDWDKSYEEILEKVQESAKTLAEEFPQCTVFFGKDSQEWNDGSKDSQLLIFVPYELFKNQEIPSQAFKTLKQLDWEINCWVTGKGKKLCVVINGRGGVGKDTLVAEVAKEFKVVNVSSIDGTKEIAKKCGWNGGKEEKDRKFLSDLKKLLIEYNDMPNTDCVKAYERFMESDKEVLFVHIREPQEIEKFRQSIDGNCTTILVSRPGVNTGGNSSDEFVNSYRYDHYFYNNRSIEESGEEFRKLIRKIMEIDFSDAIAEQLREDEARNRDVLSPETANAVYTGGGCWIFYGKCNEDGRWYMLSDTGFLLITDENPDNFDESLDVEWQEKHTVREVEGKERYDFSIEVLSILKDLVKQKNYEKTGGLFEREIEFYEIVFKNLSEE